MAESTNTTKVVLDAMHNMEPGVWLAVGMEPHGWDDEVAARNFGVARTRERAMALCEERSKNTLIGSVGDWHVSAYQVGGRNSYAREVVWMMPFGKTVTHWQQVEFMPLAEEE